MFQFHIGSIQARLSQQAESGETAFQFHIGSIQARIVYQSIAILIEFQFHIGSIQARFKPQTRVQGCGVSIPHWFDSSKSPHLQSCFRYTRFNSTLVRFKPAYRNKLKAGKLRFNSTLVRFKRSGKCGE